MKANCVVCNRYLDVDRCHIKTEKTGGTFEDDNILLMCRLHHNEQHNLGWHKFTDRHPHLLVILKNKGWKFELQFGVWKLIKV
jgi:hypothetical protein